MNTLMAGISTFVDEYPLAILCVIVVMGLLIRLRKFRKKGIFTYDEAAYYREMLAAANLFTFVAENFRPLMRTRGQKDHPDRAALKTAYAEKFPNHYAYYKAWHIYSLMAASRLGLPRDTALAVPSLFAGVFIPVFAYFGCSAFIDGRTALLASALLAVNSLHVLHSRSGGPESEMAMSFQLALFFSFIHKAELLQGGSALFYSPASLLLLAACGFFLGGIIMLHPFWAGIIPASFGAAEIVFATASGVMTPAMVCVDISVILGAMAVCMVFSDLPFLICAYLFPESGIISHMKKTFEWLLFNFKRLGDMSGKSGEESPGVSAKDKYLFYPQLFIETCGWTFSLASIGGAVLMLFHALRGYPAGAYLLAISAVFLLFMTVIPWKAARGIIIFIPVAVIMAGYGISHLPAAAAIPLILIIFHKNFTYSIRITNQVSGIRRAFEYILSNGADRFLCTSFPFSILYGTKETAGFTCHSYECIEHAYTYGYRYLVVEHHVLFPCFTTDDFLEKVMEHESPVFTAEDPCVTFFPLFREVEYLWHGVHFPANADLSKWNSFRSSPSATDKIVRVYDLESVFRNHAIMKNIDLEKVIKSVNSEIKQDKYRDAQLLLKKAMRVYSGEPILRFYNGFCHAKTGHHNWAVKDFMDLVREGALPAEYHSMCVDYLASHKEDQ